MDARYWSPFGFGGGMYSRDRMSRGDALGTVLPLENHVEALPPGKYRVRIHYHDRRHIGNPDEILGRITVASEPFELVGHGDGDAVLVLMPSARREKAEARAALLGECIHRHNFPRRKRMTMESGIGTYPTDAEDPQELLDFVDKASCEATRSRGD